MEQVGERPLVYYFHNFLSDMERRHIISLAAPQVRTGGGKSSISKGACA